MATSPQLLQRAAEREKEHKVECSGIYLLVERMHLPTLNCIYTSLADLRPSAPEGYGPKMEGQAVSQTFPDFSQTFPDK